MVMDIPEELKYSKEHLWVRVEGGKAVIGITDYAQKQLGAVKGVELPEVGDDIDMDDSFGSIEARKTVAELYAPLSGAILEVNDEVLDAPSFINDDPYDSGWLLVVRMADTDELTSLLSAEDYLDSIAEDEDDE
jgi:glycine cleavage system H protein